ncbi:hypothetical protein PY32053_01943 [Paracoccus yeei]|uniref:ABC transporter domain-containing protein n=1 Tax=Paracoccus yeei TaxID=147645 RepID=A0A386UN56_9RHOB|nr:hypothetical protein [Paracoccus yeei]AYF01560.1 hypothetical protein PY32053_01943 [Paracoccus yeei]
MAILSLRDVSKRSGTPTVAEAASFDLAPSKALSIIGPNGAGGGDAGGKLGLPAVAYGADLAGRARQSGRGAVGRPGSRAAVPCCASARTYTRILRRKTP